MAKISNLHEVLASEDVGTAGGGDKDVATVDAVLHRGHLGQEQWLRCRRPFFMPFEAIFRSEFVLFLIPPHSPPWQPAGR